MKKKQVKIGAILGFIGSVILLIVGLSGISMARMYGYETDYPVFIHYITAIVTVAFSAVGMFGAVIVIRGDFKGYTYLLIAGITGIIGTFIPIYVYNQGASYGEVWLVTFYLSNSALYVDLVLMLVGGILGFALAEKKEIRE